MYQPLICPTVLRYQARRLGATLDAKDLQRLTYPLIDRMWRNPQLDGDFFRRKMGVDETQAIELAWCQLGHPLYKIVLAIHRIGMDRGIRHRELLSIPFCPGSPPESVTIYVKMRDSAKYLLT